MILNDVAKFLAIAGAPAWIWVKHHVAFGRHPLKLVSEDVTVSRVRSAMNVQNQWIFLMRIEIGWLLQPGLDVFAIKGVVPNLFRLGLTRCGGQLGFRMRQLRGSRCRRCA